MTNAKPVGAELAREGVYPFTNDADWTDAFASKLCSYRGFAALRQSGKRSITLWEQSLLAKASIQSKLMVPDTTLSRASLAPTGVLRRYADRVNAR
ncbi:hypothetical protein CS078_18825 [Pseudomonas prosekii]|uniref:Uncharacterized protein n=1 Tax=Pseudomonas prosekii TaxID=1148509 RepID=A0A3L8CGH3_9PSED|nr:hypothetical protein [Pseudomonas prosekii]RLU07336.1 hypothetical protein CS078_18825 [Pseudomonas prosekii]